MALALSCLSSPVFSAKLSEKQTKNNKTEIAASTKAEVSVTEAEAAAVAIKETENKYSEDGEEEYEDEEQDIEDDAIETAEKNAIQPAPDTSLSAWGIVKGLWDWFREDLSESLFGETAAVGEGRTFGKIRRMQMALVPIIFKFGVMSAMIVFLVGLGIKTLFLVKVLVVMNLLILLAKIFTLKSHFGHFEHMAGPSPPAWNWSPYVSGAGWHSIPEEHHNKKEIHLHIHGGQLQPSAAGYSYEKGNADHSHGWERRNDPYSAYGTTALQGQQNEMVRNELPNEANTIASSSQPLANSFPENHRMFENKK